jgi:sulfatase maturation enzyme AslB (radical SAM superfamily)
VPNQTIFCNTPWYELHIYWDGSLGICCQEDHKLYAGTDYNIANMTIAEWFNSEPVRLFRSAMFDNRQHSACRRCYTEEKFGGNSRRIKSNQKSVIFTRQAFEPSYLQSPGLQHFEHSKDNSGWTDTQPIDLHIDLGNFCNLACKMCNARASTKIASQEVAWGKESSRQYLGVDWTRNETVWNRFIQELLVIPGLKNIHFMGGETLLTPRLEQLVDRFVAAGRFEVCFSFVTNGTVFNESLMSKLTKFQRVGIEVSIETVDKHNAYQRQGTDTELVLKNIDRYLSYCNNSSITVTLRPAVSALTVGYYAGLLKYALDKQLIVKALLCFDPAFLHPAVLPPAVKQQYLKLYSQLLDELADIKINHDFNVSDPNNYAAVVKEQAEMISRVLQEPQPQEAEHLLEQMVDHCRRWDQIYRLDARSLYPELNEVWDRYAY